MHKQNTEINMSSSVKHKLIFYSGAFVHIVFLAIFALLKQNFLIYYNIFSVSLYLFGGIFEKTSFFRRHTYAWLILMYLEITMHGIFATFILGIETAFFLYIMITLPMAAYTLFFSCDNKLFWKTMTVISMVSIFALFTTIYSVSKFGASERSLTNFQINMLRNLNILFNTLLLVGFTILFLLEINSLISKLNSTNAQLEYTATHDALTGLYNRHSLRAFFKQLSGEKFCVMLGDIDDFKKINDTYGHDCGDAVLKTVANAINEGLFDGDLVCRWGGEEILIILHGGRMDCLSRAKGIRQNVIEQIIDHNNTPVKVTMTFGFVDHAELGADAFPDGIAHMEALISLADKRLYHGKKSGKNKIVDRS